MFQNYGDALAKTNARNWEEASVRSGPLSIPHICQKSKQHLSLFLHQNLVFREVLFGADFADNHYVVYG
jgi:hypothetical protein